MTGAAARIRRLRAIRRQRRWPPFTLSLTASIIGFALLLPVIYLLIRTLDAGAESLADILLRPRTAAIILRSVVLVAIVSSASAVLALSLGWLIERTDLPFRRTWSILTVLPLVMPSYIVAFLFISVFAPLGILHRLVTEPLGIEKLPSVYGLPGAAIVLVLVSYPYTLLTVRAALRGSGRALEDASRTLGKGPWVTFLRVTLPQLRPAPGVPAACWWRSIRSATLARCHSFAMRPLRGRSISSTRATWIEPLRQPFPWFLWGSRCCCSWRKRPPTVYRPLEDTHQAELGGADSPSVPLGVWKYPALALCSLVALVALVIPMAVLLFWLIRGLGAGEHLSGVWGPALNSATVSSLAAVAAVAAALPIVVLAVRFPGRFSMSIDRISHVGFALPGIVIALALVFFGSRLVPSLYQTHVMLIFAYVILFLPVAMGPVRASLLQVNPGVEEAGRTLGHRPLHVFRTITMPLLRPGILAGGALVFLTAMKELPATLLLSPLDFSSLGTTIWAASSEAFFAQAALPALLLIAISAIPMVFLFGRGRSERA